MLSDGQNLTALLCVLGAAAYLVRRMFQPASHRDGCGAGCAACPQKPRDWPAENPAALVQLENSRPASRPTESAGRQSA